MRLNPFNPQLPARPDFFVGRTPEIGKFENFLGQTIQNSPMNLSITGNRGMGKTSILIKFEQIAKENNCLVVRLSNYEGNVKDIIELADFISANIKQEVIVKDISSQIKDWICAIKPTVGWKDFSISLEKKQILQELFRERLLKIWNEVKDKYPAIILLIDEAESLERIEGALPFLREVFQRVNSESNYMVVLAGKLNFSERMSESFSPLNRFFPVERLEPFSEKEMGDYIKRKLKTVGSDIEDNALKIMCSLSEGHPYVLVAICYIAFDSLEADEEIITQNSLKRSMSKIKWSLAQDFFKPMYHPLTPKAKKIIGAIINNLGETNNFTFEQAHRWTGMDRNNISPYILEAIRKGIINKPERANYAIFHSLFKNFIKDFNKGLD